MSVAQFPPAGPPLEPDNDDDWDDPPEVVSRVVDNETSTEPPTQREMLTFEVDFTEAKPIPFAIAFHNSTTGATERHEFTAVGDPGAGGQLALAGLVRYNRQGKTLVDLNAMLVFFERVLVPAAPADEDGGTAIPSDYDRLVELLERRDLIVPMETLGNIYSTLTARYTAAL